jgi:hypothetical protein
MVPSDVDDDDAIDTLMAIIKLLLSSCSKTQLISLVVRLPLWTACASEHILQLLSRLRNLTHLHFPTTFALSSAEFINMVTALPHIQSFSGVQWLPCPTSVNAIAETWLGLRELHVVDDHAGWDVAIPLGRVLRRCRHLNVLKN